MTATALPEVPEVSTPEPSGRGRTAVVAFFRRMHFYVGFFVGPFLLVSAVTGVMYTAAPDLARALHRHELVVDSPGATTAPLSQQVRAAKQAFPGRSVASAATGEDPRSTTRVAMAGPGCPCVVFVDPYTAQVRGQAPGDGVQVFEEKWADDLHRTLFLGELGRDYAELSASWLWILALSGPVVWFLGPGRARGKGRRASMKSWHAKLGVVLSAGLLFLSASGLSWSLHAGNNIGQLRAALSGANPPLAKKMDRPAAPSAQDQPAFLDRFDRAQTTARSVGLTDPLRVAAPDDASSAWTVSDRKRSYPLHYDRVSVDPETGRVVALSRFADWPFLARATQWAIALHMGLLFGWANKLVLALIGIGLTVMIALGYKMWWARRPRRGALPAMPARGALVDLPPSLAALAVGALLLVGWLFPELGASLVAFVLIDVASGMLARRKAAAPR